MISIYYHGYTKLYGEQLGRLLWLTDRYDLARKFGDTVKKYYIDENRLIFFSNDDYMNICGVDVDDLWRPYFGIKDNDIELLIDNGYNSYKYTEIDGTIILVLLSDDCVNYPQTKDLCDSDFIADCP